MIIPSLMDVPVGIDKNGDPVEMHPLHRALLQNLLQQMNVNLSNEGFVTPPQSASNIALLTQSQVGTILYNTDTNKGMLNENGVFKTITTS